MKNFVCSISLLLKFIVSLTVAFLAFACKSENGKSSTDQLDISVMLAGNRDTMSDLSRSQLLHRLRQTMFDVLVIGGGATGSSTALDAATRGLKVALVEGNDFSSGTSSRSTKLVHGGVRYLERAIKHLDINEFELVRDALRERKRFLKNAPHLTHPLPILTPVYSWFDAAYYWTGLKFYDLMAGRASIKASEFLTSKKALSHFPMLKAEGLKGGVLYYDGQFDDARMNITLILSALREGAVAANYLKVQGLIKEDKRVRGVLVKDVLSQKTWPIYSRVVINATGVFADSIRKMDDPTIENIMVPSQGSHIVLPASFSSPVNGLIIPKTSDGRVLFLLPWLGKTLAGTTDHEGEITEFPKASDDEVEYILRHIRNYIDTGLKRSHVLATFSGLRPLARLKKEIKDTAAASRDQLIEISPSSLITIVGGKWTTYRKMAQDVIDRAVVTGELLPKAQSQTKDLKLVGAVYYKESLMDELVTYEKLDCDIAHHLATSYGDRVDAVIGMHNRKYRKRLIEGFPFVEAEVIYAAEYEYAVHAVDVIARRMRLAFLDNNAARRVLPRVVMLMGQKHGWSRERMREEISLGNRFLDTMMTKPHPK